MKDAWIKIDENTQLVRGEYYLTFVQNPNEYKGQKGKGYYGITLFGIPERMEARIKAEGTWSEKHERLRDKFVSHVTTFEPLEIYPTHYQELQPPVI